MYRPPIEQQQSQCSKIQFDKEMQYILISTNSKELFLISTNIPGR